MKADGDAEHSEDIMIATITTLLGDEVVKFYHESTNSNRLYVGFSLSRPNRDELNPLHRNNDLNFTRAEAHGYAAKTCIHICRATTLQLAHFRTQKHHLGELIEYAWKYWSVHMFLSGNFRVWIPSQQLFSVHGPAMFINYDLKRTLWYIWVDAARSLVTLNNHLTRLGQYPGKVDDSRCLLLAKHALDSLEFPLDWLSFMIRGGALPEYSCYLAVDILHEAWGKSKLFQLSEIRSRPSNISPGDGNASHGEGGFPRQPISDLAPGILLKPSQLGSFNTHKFKQLVHSLSFLDDREKTLMAGLANTAQCLRSLCITIAQGPLFEELSKNSYSNGSPLETLVYVAHFLESMVSFPLWNHMSMADLETSMEMINPDKMLSSQEFRAMWVGVQHRVTHQDDDDLQLKIVASSPHLLLPLSRPRLLVYNIKKLCWSEGADETEFGSAEALEHQEGQNYPLCILLGHFHASTGLGHVKFTENITERHLKLKSMVLSYGYRIAFAQIIIAIIMNHNRTIFCPWLGVDIWQNPMEQLRLARSNPEVFLDEFHSCTWMDIAFNILQRAACELLSSLALKFTITGPTYSKPGRELDIRRLMSAIAYLGWIFTAVEDLFSRCVNSWAVVTAVGKLVSGESEAEQVALKVFRENHSVKHLFILGRLCWYGWITVWPICKDSLRFALNGQLGPTLLFGFITIMVRSVIVYRSVFFIPLEIGGMFVAVGWATVGFWILFSWFVHDPLGLKLSTALALFRGERARNQIERGAIERSVMLRIMYEGTSSHLSSVDAASRRFAAEEQKGQASS